MVRIVFATAAILLVTAGPVSAAETKWKVACTEDRVHRSRECVVSSGPIKVIIPSDAAEEVRLGIAPVPRTLTAIRVGNNAAIDCLGVGGSCSFPDSKTIINQMVSSKQALVQYYAAKPILINKQTIIDWVKTETDVDLDGLGAALFDARTKAKAPVPK